MATCHGLSQVPKPPAGAANDGSGPAGTNSHHEYHTVGDSLDLQLFQASRWTAVHNAVSTGVSLGDVDSSFSAASWAAAPPTATSGGLMAKTSANTHKVLRRFDFSAARLRSTVLAQHPAGGLAVYVKAREGVSCGGLDMHARSITKHHTTVVLVHSLTVAVV